MTSERRVVPRFSMTLEMQVDRQAATIRNFSSQGIYFETERKLAVAEEVTLIFQLGYAAVPGSQVACRARILRVEPRTVGFGVAATYENIAFQLP